MYDSSVILAYPHVFNEIYLDKNNQNVKWFIVSRPKMRNFKSTTLTDSLVLTFDIDLTIDGDLSELVDLIEEKHEIKIAESAQIVKIQPDQLSCHAFILNSQNSKFANLSDQTSNGIFQSAPVEFTRPKITSIEIAIPDQYIKKFDKSHTLIGCDFLINGSFSVNIDLDFDLEERNYFGIASSVLITRHQLELLAEEVLTETDLIDSVYAKELTRNLVSEVINNCMDGKVGFEFKFDLRPVSFWNQFESEDLRIALDEIFIVSELL
jgi:hypothetical protein